GKTRWALEKGRAIRDEKGNVLYLDGVILDITEHKLAIEEIINQRKRFHTILNSMNEGLIVQNLNNTQIYTNAAFCRMTQFKEDELIGMKAPFPYWPEEEIPKIMEIHKRLLNGELKAGENIELIFQKKSRERFYCLITPTPIKNADGEIISWVIITNDITERKKAEDELRKRLMKFRLDEGNIYLVKENAPMLSIEAFNNLLKAGYHGIVISRIPKKEIEKSIKYDFEFFWLTERNALKTEGSDDLNIEKLIKTMARKSAILIDRLDYFIFKNGVKETISFVQRLKDIAYITDFIIILSIDPSTMNQRELRLLEKECKEVELMYREEIPNALLDILKIVYKQNTLGLRPCYTDISKELGISNPTARKRIRRLISFGYLRDKTEGRSKVIELTERGRNLF
ncbi:MAG: PAS domain S-box protein, partial [Methermicoccaceae archaeon]